MRVALVVALGAAAVGALRMPPARRGALGAPRRSARGAAVGDPSGAGGVASAQLLLARVARPARVGWRFTRPHTFVGTALSVPALHALAAPSAAAALTPAFAASVCAALGPALLVNVFITGLNQLCDVDIDRVNKPHLPVASGELTVRDGAAIAAAALAGAALLGCDARLGSEPLRRVLLGSALLGFAYSAPPLRLKRPPARFGGSNFRTLYLSQIEVDSADFWTNRLLSLSSRSREAELASKRSRTRTLKSD